MIRFIGDVHGIFSTYHEQIDQCERSIQVGDMGMGFPDGESPDFIKMSSGDHHFIRGNHDDPAVCRAHPFYIPDGIYRNGIFYCGGGLSIDRAYRTPGVSWWEDEELTSAELDIVGDTFAVTKPKVMVTHDCPEDVADTILATYNRYKFDDPSRTRQAFQSMLERHQPKLWVFGHWHVNLSFQYGSTRFVCVRDNDYVDIDVESYL